MPRLSTRLARLEERLQKGADADPFGRVPWSVGSGEEDPGGVEVAGQWLTWEEYEATYPNAPKPLRWLDDAT